ANSPFAIADLHALTAERIAALEADAVKRLGLPPKSISTITLARDGMDPSPRGNVTVEIRAEERPGGRGGRVIYDPDGTVIQEYPPERSEALPSSIAADDHQCFQQDDADRGIAACTRILAKTELTPEDRAVAYTNLGLAHAAKGNLDQAIADQDQ